MDGPGPDWVDEPIVLCDYDPRWPRLFEIESPLLVEALADLVVGGVHHIGSTAVPGMTSKPVVDIMVGVSSLAACEGRFGHLARLGYCHSPYRPWKHWFCKPSPQLRTHHLHLLEPGHPEFQRTLRFRDRLRSDQDLRSAYSELKRQLASQHRTDREAYTDGKTEFVNRHSEPDG